MFFILSKVDVYCDKSYGSPFTVYLLRHSLCRGNCIDLLDLLVTSSVCNVLVQCWLVILLRSTEYIPSDAEHGDTSCLA